MILNTSSGTQFKIDDEDFKLFPCNCKFYDVRDKKGKLGGIYFYVESKPHRVNRFIMNLLEDNGYDVDHKNRDVSDNFRNNLMVVTRSVNSQNREKLKYTTSKFVGVSRYKKYRRWMAYIKKDGIQHHLGWFICEFDAALAYDKKARELYGQHAAVNFKIT